MTTRPSSTAVPLGRLKLETESHVVDARTKLYELSTALGINEMESSRLAAFVSETGRRLRQPDGVLAIEIDLVTADRSTTLRLHLLGVTDPGRVPAIEGFFSDIDDSAWEATGTITLRRVCPIIGGALDDAFVAQLRERLQRLSPADKLLRVILPDSIAEELTTHESVKTRRHDEVAVIFSDVVGFTRFCDGREPDEVVECLQEFSRAFEEVAQRHGVEKIKTIGDCFMATAGLLDDHENPSAVAVACGLDMIAAAANMRSGWVLRLGIHVGPVIAGIVGVRRFAYDLWGDTVNVASRMESHGVPAAVHVSEPVYAATRDLFPWEERGTITVKNRGEMKTYLLQPGGPRPRT